MGAMLLPEDHGTDQPAACAVLAYSIRDTAPWAARARSRVIIALDGELDIATAPGLAQLLAPLAKTGSHLIVHLARVRFCDCAGLSLFLRLRRLATAAGGSLQLAAPSQSLRRLIAVTQLRMILPIAANPAHMITARDGEAITIPPLLRRGCSDTAVTARPEASLAGAVSAAS
jgi:anti-sigma B factor antagonist